MSTTATKLAIASAAAGVVVLLGRAMIPWTPPERARPFLGEIAAAERSNRIPANLLARLLYQESRFRDDIITGELKSGAGAVGIAQIVPRWHPGVDPLDPVEAIHYAGGFMRRLQNEFGRWDHALAAYNWGPTALRNHLQGREGFRALPAETRNYVREILADVPAAEPDGRAIA